ncbi:hypothetical protein Mth01_08080 [Sphaerimonospora thailandensis]|uniref:Uncharacterized protein n=1 Tax=Sphaerimonospora thailandensis TaxID=795644 RepID=A0A8J3VY34_9ACTN|nr:hypothetical protein Mth01_08080 [Sphaerimonospora thailandensis]
MPVDGGLLREPVGQPGPDDLAGPDADRLPGQAVAVHPGPDHGTAEVGAAFPGDQVELAHLAGPARRLRGADLGARRPYKGAAPGPGIR